MTRVLTTKDEDIIIANATKVSDLINKILSRIGIDNETLSCMYWEVHNAHMTVRKLDSVITTMKKERRDDPIGFLCRVCHVHERGLECECERTGVGP